MFRAAISRRRVALLASTTAAAVAVGVSEPREKLPIYPSPTPILVLQETPSPLELQIGTVRHQITSKYEDAYEKVQGVVDGWVAVERRVERRVKSIISPEEELTPNLLYIGISTLTGSILARTRSLPTRFILPTTFLLVSLNHFLPQTSHNLNEYVRELERTYTPTLAQKHDVAIAHSQMTVEMVKEKSVEAKRSVQEGVLRGVVWVEGVTGLKFKEGLGLGREIAGEAKEKVESVQEVVRQKVEEAKVFAKEKAEDVKETVEKKIEEVKESVHEKAEGVKVETEKKVEEVKRLV